MLRRISGLVALLTIVFCHTYTHSQIGARTVPRSLDYLASEADVIVHGYVRSVKIEPHPQLQNLMTVVVSMGVKDTYKGAHRDSLTFRQYVWNAAAGRSDGDYRKGQELVLLLGPVSEYGLTSPVGLEQGRFSVVTGKDGKKTAVNGRNNLGLFSDVNRRVASSGLKLSAHTSGVIRQNHAGPLPLSDLEDVLRAFVGVR